MPPLSSQPGDSGNQLPVDDQNRSGGEPDAIDRKLEELQELHQSQDTSSAEPVKDVGSVTKNRQLATYLAITIAVIFLIGGAAFAGAIFNSQKSPQTPGKPAVVEPLTESVNTPSAPLPSESLSVTSLSAQDASISALNVTGSAAIQGNLSVYGNGIFGGTIQAANFQGSGAGLTGVNASQLGGHSASFFTNLATGLSGAALLAGNNTFTGANTFTTSVSAGSISTNSVTTNSLNALGSITATSLTLGQPLSVADGGIGLNNVPTAAILYGQGGPTLGVATPPSAGLCLLSGTNSDTWGSCSGAIPGVATLDNLSGLLTIANSTGAGTTVTINDASTAAKGIAQFNPNDFQAAGGVIDTVQSIATTAAPVFAGLTLGSALTVANGGTGTNSLTANGVLLGNGTNPVTSLTTATPGQCLLSTAGAPAFGNCPGSGGVATVDNLAGALTLADSTGVGTTITIQDASTAQKGIVEFNSTNFSVAGGIANTIQNIATNSSPQFGQLSLTSSQAGAEMLTVNNTNAGATGNLIDLQLNGSPEFKVAPNGNTTVNGTLTSGAVNGQTISNAAAFTGTLGVSGLASLNGGATVTGTLTSNSLSPTGALTVGAAAQQFTLQGNAGSSITSTGGGFTTTVDFAGAPTASQTYQFDRTSAAGTYTICTTAGNCSGVGGGVTTPGGTVNKLAKFTAGQTIGSSSISDTGSSVTLTPAADNASVFQVQNAAGRSLLNVDTSGNKITLGNITSSVGQAVAGELVLGDGTADNFGVNFTPATLTANRTITVPDSAGTIAVSATGPISLSANGTISCATCLTSGGGGGSAGVSSLDLLTGALTIANSTGTGTIVTINNAKADGATEGIATFNATDLKDNGSGLIDTIQAINTTASPTFGQLTLTSSQATAEMLVANNTNPGASGNLLDLKLNGSPVFTVNPSGNVASGTINGQTITSSANFTGSLAVGTTLTTNTISPTGALTVGATSQQFTLQGNASSTITATGGGQVTTVGFSGAPVGAVSYNFDRSVAAGSYTICTTVGNCAGSGSGVTTAGGTVGDIPVFTASQALGNSLLSEAGGTVTVAGNLNLTSGNQYEINSSQISSANLSNDSNLAKLNATQTFTGANLLQNAANSTTAFEIKDTANNVLLDADTTNDRVAIGGTPSAGSFQVFGPTLVGYTNSLGAFGVQNANFNNVFGVDTVNNVVAVNSPSNATSGTPLVNSVNLAFQSGYWNGATNASTAYEIQNVALSTAPTYELAFKNNASQTVLSLQGNGAATFENGTNSSNAFSIQNSSGHNLVNVDTSGNVTTFGNITSSAGQGIAGTLDLADGTNDNFGATLNTTTLTGNQTVTIPNASGQICLTSGNCAGVGGTLGGTGTTNQLAKFTSSSSVGNSSISDTGSSVTIVPTSNSATGFQVQNAATASVLALDTTTTSNNILTITNQTTNKNASLLTLANSDGSGGIQISTGGTAGAGANAQDTYIGYQSGQNSTLNAVTHQGQYNTALGYQAIQGGSGMTGSYDTGVGYGVLQNVTSGSYNAAFGNGSAQGEQSGTQNAAYGAASLSANQIGNDNTAIGYDALNNTGTSGAAANYNTAVGAGSLFNNVSGVGNVAIGFAAGQGNPNATNTSGNGNIFIGYQAGTFDGGGFLTPNSLQNSTAIGYQAQVQESNALILGGAGGQAVNVGIGTTIPESELSVSPMAYNSGTAGVTSIGTTITGTGTNWTSALVGDEFIFATGQEGLITSVTNQTSLIVATSQAVVSPAISYRIQLPGLEVSSNGTAGLGMIPSVPSGAELQVTGQSADNSSAALQITNSSGTNVANFLDDGTVDLGGSSTTNIYGKATEGTSFGTGYQNGLLSAQLITATKNGPLTSISSWIGAVDPSPSSAHHGQFAIYSDNGSGSKPVNFLGSSAVFNLKDSTWNTASVATLTGGQVNLASGTSYWIVYWTDDGTGTYNGQAYTPGSGTWYYYGGGPVNYFGSQPDNGFPATFPTGTGPAAFTFSIYATQITNGQTEQLAGSNGAATFQNSADSTGAFQVQNAAGSDLVDADTTNMRVSVGSIGTATGQLYVAGSIPSGTFGTYGVGQFYNGKFAVAGSYAYVAEYGSNKMDVIDISNPASPTQISHSSAGIANPSNIVIEGKYAYVSSNSATGTNFGVVDISDPMAPTPVAQLNIAGSQQTGPLLIQGRYAYLEWNDNSSNDYLAAIDISNPLNPTIISTVHLTTSLVSIAFASGITISGKYMYVLYQQTSGTGMQIFNIANPYNITPVGTLAMGTATAGLYDPTAVTVVGRYAYVASINTPQTGQVVDISDPTTPTVVGTFAAGHGPIDIAAEGNRLYVDDYSTAGIQVDDITNPLASSNLGTMTGTGNANSMDIQGRYAYAIGYDATPSLIVDDLGGTYSQTLQAGSVQASDVNVSGNIQTQGNLSVLGGITAGTLNLQGDEGLNGNLNVYGNVLLKPTTASTGAFMIQSASATILDVDTVNGEVGIGTNAPTAPLDVVGQGSTNLTYAQVIRNQGGSSIAKFRNDGTVDLGQSSSTTFGDTTVEGTLDSGAGSVVSADRYITPTAGASVTSMSVYVGGTDPVPANDHYKLGIYTDNNGAPGTLVAQSAQGSLVGNSWNTIAVSASLTGNTFYWLAMITNTGSSGFNDPVYSVTTIPTHAFLNNTYSSGFPATMNGANVNDYYHSIYANLSNSYTPGLTVGASGNVGIGTSDASSPAANLTVQTQQNNTEAFQVQNSSGTSAFNVDTQNNITDIPSAIVSTGTAKFQNGTNSTSSFNVQDTAYDTLFNIDTSNVAVSVGQYVGTLGYTTVGGSASAASENHMNSRKITTTAAGTLESVSVYFINSDSAPNNKYQVALYSDSSGAPGSLLASSASDYTITPGAWNTAPLNYSLAAGTSYWLSVNDNSTSTLLGEVAYDSLGTDHYASIAQTYGTWPGSFGTPTTSNTNSESMYGNIDYGPALSTNSSGNVGVANNLNLGSASTATGSATFYNAGGSGSIKLQAANPGSSNYTITLPNSTGTVCLSSGNCPNNSSKSVTEIVAMGATACSTPASVASNDIPGADYVASGCSAQTAIQNAISALPAGGGIVYLEEGTYIMSGGITLPSNVTLEGAGADTILEYENSFNGLGAMMISLSSNSTNRVTIQDITVNGNISHQSSGSMYGIYAASNSSPGVDINNVWADNFYGSGIAIDSPGTVANCEASGNVLAGSGIGVYDLENDTSISNCNASSNTIGFEVGGVDDTLTGSTAESNSSYGIFALGQGDIVTGDMSDNNGNYGFFMGGAYSTVTGSTSTRNGGDGIILDLNNETATGNNVGGANVILTPYGNQGDGIGVLGNNDLVGNNVIYVYNGFYSGVSVTGDNDSVSNNQIIGGGGSGYAIKISVASAQTYLAGNTYSGTGATSLLDSGNDTQYVGQTTNNNDMAIQGSGAVDVGTTNQGTATLTVNGGINTVQLSAPSWGGLGGATFTGTPGTATWGYKITALDGTGETVASTQQTTAATAATTLNGTNYNTVQFPYESGAVKYNVYRTLATNCVSPCSLGLVTTITAGTLAATNGTATNSVSLAYYISWKDTGFAAGAAPPTSNYTGGATFVGPVSVAPAANSTTAFQVQNASAVNVLTVDTTNERVYIGPTAGDTVGALLVLGNKTNAGDPTGTNGAMYYNSSINRFRCYENSTWKNCIGVDEDNQRQSPNLSTDFIGPGDPGVSPWSLIAVPSGSGGTFGHVTGVANHPGIVFLGSLAANGPNTGYAVTNYTISATGIDTIAINGGESWELVFSPTTLDANTTSYMGFIDNNTGAAPTNGIYMSLVNTTLTGVGVSGGTSTNTGTTDTLTAGHWYRARVVVNPGATAATFTVTDLTASSTWTDSVSSHIPSLVGDGVESTYATAATHQLLSLDYMAFWYTGVSLNR